MTIGAKLALRLREIREASRIPQDTVGTVVGLAGSAISQIEGGASALQVDHLVGWAAALGRRADVVFWQPVLPSARPHEAHVEVLAEVASALPHMPPAARAALVEKARLWKAEAVRIARDARVG